MLLCGHVRSRWRLRPSKRTDVIKMHARYERGCVGGILGWEDEGGGGGNSWRRRQRARKINGWPPVATEQGKETRVTHEPIRQRGQTYLFCNHYTNFGTRARTISRRSAKFEQEMQLIHPSWSNLKTNRIHRHTIQVVHPADVQRSFPDCAT